MSSPSRLLPAARRRLAGAAVSACLLIGLLVGLLPSSVAAGTHDGAVTQAAQRLDQAHDRAASLQSALDRAAESYERSWAHRTRLEAELTQAAQKVTSAHEQEELAREALRRRVAAAYRAPHADLALAEAVLDAPDAATALHVAALMSRLTVRSAREIDDQRRAERRAAHALRQRRIIASGAASAAEAQRREAARLAAALEQAQDEISRARRDLDRARARAREAGARGTVSSAPTPVVVDGKTCPVAGPTGFIDSWGFPRSGGRTHKGVDMFAAHGTPLVAVADGVVRRVWVNRLGGLSVDLVDTRGDRYYYAHLSSAAVNGGERVAAGQVIGAVGQTGNASGTPPHLHWQFHPGDGEPVNPYPLARALCR